MKKTFLLLILFLFSLTKVLADDVIIMPQWYEYCPNEYFSAEYINYKELKRSEKTGYIIKGLISGTNYIEINNYWVERRNDFNTELNLCLKLTEEEDRNICYMQLKKIQKNENQLYGEIQNLKYDLAQERNRNLYGH